MPVFYAIDAQKHLLTNNKKMTRQKQTKHNYQQAIGYWDVLPLTGLLCPISNDSFAIRFDKNENHHWPEFVQT